MTSILYQKQYEEAFKKGASVYERVPFKHIQTECCGVLLCWVNPRLPNYCPECGKKIFPAVKSWVTDVCDGLLKLMEPDPNRDPIDRLDG